MPSRHDILNAFVTHDPANKGSLPHAVVRQVFSEFEIDSHVRAYAAGMLDALEDQSTGQVSYHTLLDKLYKDEGESVSCPAANEASSLASPVMPNSEEEVARNLFSKGFSLRQLLAFVDRYCHTEKRIRPETTTAQVVFQIVVPETRHGMCCYADILPGGPREPETLMSHWWGNRFLDLVRAICSHASGKMELFADFYSDSELNKTFWLCIFGVNQHVSICDTIPEPCTCASPKYKSGLLCQMNKFPLVMQHIRKHALAMDSKLQTLTRVWVLSELNTALYSDTLDTEFCGVDLDLEKLLNANLLIPSVRDCEASYAGE